MKLFAQCGVREMPSNTSMLMPDFFTYVPQRTSGFKTPLSS